MDVPGVGYGAAQFIYKYRSDSRLRVWEYQYLL